jgi:hypothetical protein
MVLSIALAIVVIIAFVNALRNVLEVLASEISVLINQDRISIILVKRFSEPMLESDPTISYL